MLEKEEEEEDTKQAVEFNVTLSEECPERSEMEGAREEGEETEVNKEMLRIATEWKRSTDAACRIRATLA